MLSDTVTRICRAGLIVVFNAAIVIQSVLCIIMLSTVSCPAFTCCRINYASHRLQNSPYFCVFKYARAVKQKVWNEAENRERDWGETPKIRTVGFFPSSLGCVRLARFARVRLLPISLLILRKKTDCFAVYASNEYWSHILSM